MDKLNEWQVDKYARLGAQPAEDGKDWEILESSDGRVITLTIAKAGVLKVVVSGLLLEYWNLCQTKDMRVLQRDHSLLFLCRAKGTHRKWRVMFYGSSGKVAEERCSQCLRAIHTFLHPSFPSQSFSSSQNTTHSQNINTQPPTLNSQTQPLRNTSQPPRHASQSLLQSSQSLLQSSQSIPTSQSLLYTSQPPYQNSQSLLTSQSFPQSQSLLQTTQLPYQTSQSLLQTSQSFPTCHTLHQTSQPPTTSQSLPTSQSIQQPPATHSILTTTQAPPSSTQPLQKAAHVSQSLPPPTTTTPLQNSQTLPPMPPLHTPKPPKNPLPAFQQLPPPPPLLNHPQPPQDPLLPPSSQSFPQQVSQPLPSPQQPSELPLPPHQTQSLPPLNQTSESIPQPSQTSQSLPHQSLPSTHQAYQSIPLPHQTSHSLPLRPQASYPLSSPYLYTQPPFSAPYPPAPLYPQYPGAHLHNNQWTEGTWVPGYPTHSVLRPQPTRVHNPLVPQPSVSTTQQLSYLYPTLPRSDGLTSGCNIPPPPSGCNIPPPPSACNIPPPPSAYNIPPPPSGCNIPPPALQPQDSNMARTNVNKCPSKVKGSKKKSTVKRGRKPKVPLQPIDVNTDAWPPVLSSLGGDGGDDVRLKQMVVTVLRDPGLPHLVHAIHNIITNM